MTVWAIETLIASTLLMLLVLTLRSPVRRIFGPNIAYALWAIPAFRVILPPLPDSWHQGVAVPLTQAGETIAYYIVEPLSGPADAVTASGPGIWPWLLAAWVIGATGFIGYHAVAHGRFCARVRRLASRSEIVACGNVEVIETDAATGPLAFGIWHKYVAFPRDFADRYDPLERDLALAHELGHHARGDLIANWAALVMLAIHWFNPVAWRAFRAFRADQEMACDALVLAGRAGELRAAYGRAIVKSAHGGAVSAACHLHTINDIKGRLKMLTKHETKSRGRIVAGIGATTALLLGGLGLTASGTQAAETVRSGVESAVGVDLASLALPSLPQSEPLPPPPGPPVPPPAPQGSDVHRTVTTTTGDDGKVNRVTHVIIRDKDGKMTEFNEGGGKPGERVERRRYIFRSKDGKPMTWEGGPDTPMPPEMAEKLRMLRVTMPEINSRTCTDAEGKAGENVIRRQDGDKKVMIICTNRIESMASLAALDGDKVGQHGFVIRRQAEGSALEGLRSARRSIEGNRSMSDTQRSAALSGIDQAIREMEAKRD